MSEMGVFEGEPAAGDLRIAVVAARFNDFIVERLVEGALATLRQHGVAESGIDLVRVPGAFELPVTIARLLAAKRHAAVVALGCIIRGDTPHFDFVAAECARGLGQLALDTGVPIAFGVLTTENVDQALERAGASALDRAPARRSGAVSKQGVLHGNKGAEAAECALRMAHLLQRLGK